MSVEIKENHYGKWEITKDEKGKTISTKLLKVWVNNPPKRFREK